MPISRLELPSFHGDQTLGEVRFVLHGSSAASGQQILQHGLSFTEGSAVVTTNLAHASGCAVDPGMMTVLALPREFHLGYAAFTTCYIARSVKLVMGAPLRYAGARNHLALYLDSDIEAARKRIEAAAGLGISDQPSFQIGEHNVLGAFKPTPVFQNIIASIEVSAKAFEAIDSVSLESSLIELFDCREAAQAVLVPIMARDMVVGTVESVMMSRMRMMRWQGLGLLGYRFREGTADVAVSWVKDIAEQRQRIEEYDRKLASSMIFNGELAWLKTYALSQLQLMRVELDGAELEST